MQAVVFIMKKALKFLQSEFLEMLPPTIYFLVVFHIVAFTRALMAEEYGINFTSSVSATIGALIIGKSILLADALPFVNKFRPKGSVYNVAWRMFIYISIVLLFLLLEELIPLSSKYGSFATAIEHVHEARQWPRFWATFILCSIFLLFYSLTTEVIAAIGRNEFLKIFFRSNRSHSGKVD